MCPTWFLVAVAVVGVARGAVSQCWEHPSCQDVSSESSMMECVQLCRSDLTAESPILPGHAHLQSLAMSDSSPLVLSPSSSSSSSSPQAKRSYSMEHFRWGKPVGRKRRPIKVYTSNGVEEESAEVFPGEMRRRGLADELLAAAAAAAAEEEEEQEAMEKVDEDDDEGEEQNELPGGDHHKKDGTYKKEHFRFGGLPAAKRYGGFMKSWDERSQRPLLTLFKNVINKDGQQQK